MMPGSNRRLALLATGILACATLLTACAEDGASPEPGGNTTTDPATTGPPERLHEDDAYSGDAVIIANVNQIDTCDIANVDVFVSLLTIDDKVFVDARPDEMIVRIDGEVVDGVTLRTVDEAQLPLNSVLVLDKSGSMAGERMENLKFAAQSYVDKKADDDRTAIVAFDGEVEEVSDYSSDRRQLQQDIENITPNGATAIYDALQVAIDQAPDCGRKAVLLMSDGEDNESTVAVDDVLESARAANIPVFVIGLEMDRRVGERLAGETNAQYFEVNTPQEFASVYDRIDAQLAGQYVLGLDLSEVERTGDERTVEVIFGNGQYRTYGSGTVVH